MRRLLFITHADVLIDPNVPVERWPLNDKGRARHEAFSNARCLDGVLTVYSSAEQKAMDGAEILSRARGIPHRVEASLHENDRTATGFLPPEEFERVADAFFAKPEESVRGWERACDAQARVVSACQQVARTETEGDIAIVAHGGVGALLLCYATGVEISRSYDQPGRGGGNVIILSLPTLSVIESWQSLETLSEKTS